MQGLTRVPVSPTKRARLILEGRRNLVPMAVRHSKLAAATRAGLITSRVLKVTETHAEGLLIQKAMRIVPESPRDPAIQHVDRHNQVGDLLLSAGVHGHSGRGQSEATLAHHH